MSPMFIFSTSALSYALNLLNSTIGISRSDESFAYKINAAKQTKLPQLFFFVSESYLSQVIFFNTSSTFSIFS